ncbi:MAG TPA: selenocysteine-specific translation elongation factor [Candidatus Binataceae bacterium]|nr:selenocysteine-specific translation elongation factor [Candidatus Binataceae bacterium]
MAIVTHAIIGTAGHIDHGKTALVRALTGQETDRLKEERERGISIDLGFAYFTLPDGTRAGLVDVPGHERFIRNMLAGAHGIDLVLFTVAADDGVMPQSEEHLDILHLLGVGRGIFVITKADLADQRRLADVREEIELLADGTVLEGSPTVAVSSMTGAGIDELRAEMTRQLEGFQARRATGLFRLPLDRAFVIKGHGTVVTGTAMGASVHVGQKLRALPSGEEVRVRSIQVHGEGVEHAGLCQRVALNLTGAEKVELKRGDLLADDRLELTTTRLDTRLEIRPAAKRALRNNQRVRFYIGTAETIGRVIVLDPALAEIAPKHSALTQIVLNEPMVALAGDRFVIRDETNMRTLGGGVVLNPAGRRVRKPLADYLRNLSALSTDFGAAAVEAMLNLQDRLALPPATIAQVFNAPIAEVENALKDARFLKLSLGDEEGFTTAAKWQELKRVAIEALAACHRDEPLAPGLEMESLRTRLPYDVSARAFRALVDRLGRETELVREENLLRLKSHKVQLGGGVARLAENIDATLTGAGFHPPDLKQLADELKLAAAELPRLRTLLAAMEREGRVIKVATDLYFARVPFESARAQLMARLEADGEISAATYRDALNASRKYAIALLDYFDHNGVTTRVGDVRKLRAHQ